MSIVANVADLIAAIGVIGSLVFVALQVRENTRTVRNTYWENHLNRLASNFSRPLDPDVAAAIRKGNESFDSLGEDDKIVYSAWANEYMLSTSFLLVFRDEGNLNPELTNTAERRISWFFGRPGAVQWWRHELRHPIPRVVEAQIDQWIARNAG